VPGERFFHTCNVVTIVAWAGVGKSTLVNHWLRQMATDHYRSAQLVFGWSFYRQGTSGGITADEFAKKSVQRGHRAAFGSSGSGSPGV
jgi:hypothetical protein